MSTDLTNDLATLTNDLARLDQGSDETLATLTNLRREVARLTTAVDGLTRETRRLRQFAPPAVPVAIKVGSINPWLFVGLGMLTTTGALWLALANLYLTK